MGRRTGDYLTLDVPCPACGEPLTTPWLGAVAERRRPASPATVRLCVLCVARALVRGTLAIHGPPGAHPASNRCEGHEERMRLHEERVANELTELGEVTRDA